MDEYYCLLICINQHYDLMGCSVSRLFVQNKQLFDPELGSRSLNSLCGDGDGDGDRDGDDGT